MNITVIASGTELLRGTTVNTNLSGIGLRLLDVGIEITRSFTVGDSPAELRCALQFAVDAQSDVIIISGGLGPTTDDLTRDVAAEFVGRPLAVDPALREHLQRYWNERHYGWEAPAGYWLQAQVPNGAEILRNPNGTAPGLYMTGEFAGRERHFFLLPGPPSELLPMVENELLQRLLQLKGDSADQRLLALLLTGVPELKAQEAAQKLTADLPVELAYCASAEGTRLFCSCCSQEILAEAEKRVRQSFGAIIPEGHELSLVPDVVRLLKKSGKRLALAESCTGGKMAAELTELPGVSAVFNGGIVCYANEVKIQQLGVAAAIIAEHGAVSRECALAMAEGAAKRLGAECAIAVTGIAGPDGGTAAKPVGLVFIAIHTPHASRCEEFHFPGDRQAVRHRATARGWILLREQLIKESGQ